jgi:hypothetical protein
MPLKPLSEVIAAFEGRVYGLVEDHRGLRQTTYGHAMDLISLNFKSGPVREPTLGVRLETMTRTGASELTPEAITSLREQNMKMNAYTAAFEFGPQSFRESELRRRKLFNRADPLSRFSSEVITGLPLSMPEISMSAGVLRCQAEALVHVLVFESNEVQLTISTSGIETGGLAELLAVIAPIEDQPEVWERYDQESKECLAELAAGGQ